MTQKTIAALLCMMLSVSLAACSTAPESETSVPTTSTTAPAATTTVPETSKPAEPAFEEIILVDNGDILFKITAVEQDPIWGYTWKVYMENKTEKELMFSADAVSVNGFMCDPYWAVSVAPGKKSNNTISWLDSTLAENGIEDVNEVTFTLRVYDSNDWLADDILQETFTVNP